MSRILGIDPGSRITGFGVVDVVAGKNLHVESGTVRPKLESLPERLGELFRGVREVIAQSAPDQVAIENVFMHRNADSALKLGQARGAIIAAAVESGIPVFEYTPAEIKQAVVGKGGATKEQVQHMVRLLLSLGELQPDQADALACALCHAHHAEGLAAMTGVTQWRRGRAR
jgi:crossover junction endodeoxyribonuclease RuvC